MKKIDKKKLGLIICIVSVVIICLVGVFVYLNSNKDKITTNMQFEYLGYNEYYENDSETLTVFEATKVLTSIYAKIYNITEIVSGVTDENEAWKNYAYEMRLSSRQELEDTLTYVKLFDLIYNCEKEYRDINTGNVTNTLGLSQDDFFDYQINAVNYLYSIGLIDSSKVDRDTLKSEVNKTYFEDLVIQCIFKFNLLDLGGDIIDYEKSLNISQSKDYFFVTNNVKKSELKIKKNVEYEQYLSPKEIYPKIRYDIGEIKKVIEDYFNIILNVDYSTIMQDSFKKISDNYPTLSDDEIIEYCNYVKENNIQLLGKVDVIYPIIYYADDEYYVKVNLEYDVIGSKAKKDILFGNIKDNAKSIYVRLNNNILGWHIKGFDM